MSKARKRSKKSVEKKKEKELGKDESIWDEEDDENIELAGNPKESFDEEDEEEKELE